MPTYTQLAYLHLAILVPVFLIGGVLLLQRKGTAFHRYFGKVFMVLILLTAALTLGMKAELNERTVFNHFGASHLFSVAAIVMVAWGWSGIRRGNIRRHKRMMLWLYFGAIVVNGFFALNPDRMLGQLLAAFAGPSG